MHYHYFISVLLFDTHCEQLPWQVTWSGKYKIFEIYCDLDQNFKILKFGSFILTYHICNKGGFSGFGNHGNQITEEDLLISWPLRSHDLSDLLVSQISKCCRSHHLFNIMIFQILWSLGSHYLPDVMNSHTSWSLKSHDL